MKKIHLSTFYFLLSTILSLALWSAIPQNALADGWACRTGPDTFPCYSTEQNCKDVCNPSSGCYEAQCVPGSTNQNPNPPQPPSPPPPITPLPVTPGSGGPTGPGSGGPTGSGQSLSLPNPLGNASTIPQLLERIAGFLTLLAAPLVAIMVLFGAYQMLFAAGDPEKFSIGKKTILYAVIGYTIILIAWGVTGIIRSVLRGDSASPNSSSTSPVVSPSPGGAGATCTRHEQCVSLTCGYANYSDPSGTCDPPSGVGGGIGASCTRGDVDCASGLFCNFSAGVPGRCSATPLGGSGGQGASCTISANCTFPFRCQYVNGTDPSGTCQP